MTHSCQPSCQTECSLKNSMLLQSIQYTAEQLEASIDEANKFHAEFLIAHQVNTQGGLINSTTPDWAPKLIRRNGIANAVIEKLGSNAFAKRRPQDTRPFLNFVENSLTAQKPLQFRIAFGPLKNIRCNGSDQSPDLAEYLTFVQLSRVMSAISAIYPHGVKVQIVPDDMRALTANRCAQCYTHCYIGGLQKMVKLLSFENWISVEFGQTELYEVYNVTSYQHAAETKIIEWQKNDPESFTIRWQTALENAYKNFNIELTADTPEEVEAAAWRYLIAHQCEILSGMWSPQEFFPLVYANHPNCYQLYSIGTKKTKLPWQISLPMHLVDNTKIQLAA
jgi:hypothetical protein